MLDRIYHRFFLSHLIAIRIHHLVTCGISSWYRGGKALCGIGAREARSSIPHERRVNIPAHSASKPDLLHISFVCRSHSWCAADTAAASPLQLQPSPQPRPSEASRCPARRIWWRWRWWWWWWWWVAGRPPPRKCGGGYFERPSSLRSR